MIFVFQETHILKSKWFALAVKGSLRLSECLRLRNGLRGKFKFLAKFSFCAPHRKKIQKYRSIGYICQRRNLDEQLHDLSVVNV